MKIKQTDYKILILEPSDIKKELHSKPLNDLKLSDFNIMGVDTDEYEIIAFEDLLVRIVFKTVQSISVISATPPYEKT